MGNQPWLDSLSDDWVSQPRDSPASAGIASPVNPSSRRSSIRNSPTPSRIPVRNSITTPQKKPLHDDKKKIPRPCHSIRREPPTPKTPNKFTPRLVKTPVKKTPIEKTPVEKKTPKKTPASEAAKTDPKRQTRSSAAHRRQASTPSKKPPSRSVSALSTASNQTVQHNSTVQRMSKKGSGGEGTPEWRKRLVRGEVPAGEQCDLFAPMGLESVFKPPPPGSEAVRQEALALPSQTDSFWAFTENGAGSQGQDTENATEGATGAEDSQIHHEIKEAGAEAPRAAEEPNDGTFDFTPDSDKENRPQNDARDESPSPSYHRGGPNRDSIRSRTVSGMEELRNEGLTPIFLSRNNTLEGKGPSDIIESALQKLNTKLEKMSLKGRYRPGSRASDSGIMYQNSDDEDDGSPGDDLLDVTSHSLPKDLSMGTLDFASRGAFVNLRRGGYSDDSSFQARQLTPSSFPSQFRSPSFLANSKIRSSPPQYELFRPSRQQSELPSDAPTPPAVMVTPARDSNDRRQDSAAMKPSISPLKLFGNHDTFTNNKLLRRMSQFEETFGDISEEEDEPLSPSESSRRRGRNRSRPSSRRGPQGTGSPRSSQRPRSQGALESRMNRFGIGQLDRFDFSDTSPNMQGIPKSIFDDSLVSPTHRSSPAAFSSPIQPENQRSLRSTASFKNSRNGRRHSRILSWAKSHPPSKDVLLYQENAEIKRALNTPARTSTPKRRRTLQKPGQYPQNFDETLELVTDTMGSMSLLQRSLVHQGIVYDLEKNGLLQRPKTPTHAQEQQNGEDDSPYQDENTKPGQRKVGGHPMNTGAVRKGSITTQDFLDEATKIMNLIRAKGKPINGLESVEETEMANPDGEQVSGDESTQEEFSRPPSRDGLDLRRLREIRPHNPRVASHLKKFEERDDQDLTMSGSTISLRLAERGQNGDEESSPQNIRIRGNPFMQRKRKHSEPKSQDGATMNTQDSSNSLSGRSIPTRSSNGSNAKGMIPSDLVSHLIPELVNGMSYDRATHMWVKKSRLGSINRSRTEDSEDDPFQDISDLSVDEIQELMRIRELEASQKIENAIRSAEPQDGQPQETRPQSKDGDPSLNASSVQSKATPFGSSGPKTDTRATSWGTPELDVNRIRDADAQTDERLKEAQHEMHLHNGHTSAAPQPEAPTRQPRVVTISFSSPLVSHVAYPENSSPQTSEHGTPSPGASGTREATVDESHPGRLLRNVKNSSRRRSLEGKPFVGRSVSRIDEQSEESTNNLSLIQQHNAEDSIATPLSNGRRRSLSYSSIGNDTSYSFHLSPLPDFTVNQIDDPLQLELSYVAQRTHHTSLRQVHGTFALAAEDLIKHITDVEPYEPYWEDIRRLDLSNKGLITLHRLNEFCPRLEELDASHNDIGQLSGVPPTLRHLRIQRNCLSSLTAWGHLVNLQYLDVSGNGLENLDAFSGLIHLRELKANNNKIHNLDGILDLDGLLSLKLKNNELAAVDFEGSELTRLKEIDLSHNRLTSVENIAYLPSLEDLDLSSNYISSLPCNVKMRTLHSLKLSDNRISALDVSSFPSLRLLYVDRNSLSTVAGIGKCHELEILSAREQSFQKGDDPLSLDLDLGLLKDVRKVFLSSNRLSPRTLSPSLPMRSVQLLDLASCALPSLPEDFAINFPNVKVLNLNFNALSDAGGIVGMKCLGRLTLVGNRFTRLRRLCQVLAHVGKAPSGNRSSLKRIDLRGNPLTVGFYPPALSGSGRSDAGKLKDKEEPVRKEKGLDEDGFTARANLGGHEDVARVVPWIENGGELEQSHEIDDPYTLPPADVEADRKYVARLDESTKLRRRVVELMLYAATGGAVKVLDGLELRSSIGEEVSESNSDVSRVWSRLEELGVLKKKEVVA
ncbi:hypothetical protein AOR_1_1896144 [Paecilomyces variotii No. 5]|uniref:Uncharacterized protein n=1 Tax=Byssochlamys spectabilis (strain No. 5 / NBRC 109023) TaxID=1356009 RepID=V5GDN4_BYSSN|nr:hypothetical protein AOR_1_1896144 [Paecilomyces variotii No. 5]